MKPSTECWSRSGTNAAVVHQSPVVPFGSPGSAPGSRSPKMKSYMVVTMPSGASVGGGLAAAGRHPQGRGGDRLEVVAGDRTQLLQRVVVPTLVGDAAHVPGGAVVGDD